MLEAEKPNVDSILATPDLAGALDTVQFRQFLDLVPVAIVISEMKENERLVYANLEFGKLLSLNASDVVGKPWNVIKGRSTGTGPQQDLSAAIVEATDFLGTFSIQRLSAEPTAANVYSNVITDDDGTPAYRLVALAGVITQEEAEREDLAERLREKDTLLLEMQHRVKNNLQMITALIRIEARNARGTITTLPLNRLAGRIESIQLLYRLLSDHQTAETIDLGVYLSEIASSVMRAHAVEGIRLDLKVDAYPVSLDVAMPTGLMVNELLTNAIKHAFTARGGGTITLHSLSDGTGCRIVVADNGNGLPEGAEWPKSGKLSALIVHSLRENAKAKVNVESTPGRGMRVTIAYTRSAATPKAT